METLAERIARDGPVSELDAIGWAIRLAKRLEALHALGVAHGSVSPACVIAAGQDRNARAYLADVQHTTASPSYHSPERILGGDISAADDVWALAATLYALLTGQSPFTGHTDPEIRQKILAAAPPPLAVYDVGDDDLQHILDRAFAREIGQRTSGISSLRHALEEWHPDRGVANLPPLEDEDTTDEDDGARTMLVRDAGGYLAQVGLGTGLPKLNEDDEDDEDNVRTQMRQLPKDDLAAIIARASAARPAAAPAPPPRAPFPAAAPAAAFPRPGPPRPAGGPPRPAAPAQPAPVVAPAAPQPQAAVPNIHDEDSEDENIRTVMRTPEQMIHEEESHDAPRTVLLADHPGGPEAQAWRAQPGPAAGHPGAGSQPWNDGPAPAPTVALPAYYEPAAPSFAMGEGPGQAGGHPQTLGQAGGHPQTPGPPPQAFAGPADSMLAAAQGTQKIPPGEILRAHGPGAAYAGAPGLAAIAAAPAQPFQPAAQQVLGAAPPPQPLAPAAQPAPSGKRGLVLAALFALLMAAAATFAFLKLKGL